MLPQDVRVNAQGHGRVGVAEAGGDDMHRHPGEQTGNERFTNHAE
jgi:hypothetical protein